MKSKTSIALCRILQQQGFGSRRECVRLVWDGKVSIGGKVQTEPNAMIDTQDLVFEVAGRSWNYRHHLYIKLNKPAGYECTRQSGFHQSLFALIPPQFSERGLQSAGRLDVDTSGIIFLSDDGQFLHHITSPRREIAKRYRVLLKHEYEPEFLKRLNEGVVLRSEKQSFQAQETQAIDSKTMEMVIAEGKFHQVKRMVGAAGNRVEALQRLSIGSVGLGDLAEGKWQELSAIELEELGYKAEQ